MNIYCVLALSKQVKSLNWGRISGYFSAVNSISMFETVSSKKTITFFCFPSRNISFLDRVTDFRLSQVSNVFENWAYRDEYGELAGVNEHNPLIAILKNSVFGEFINGMYFESGMVNVCRIFFWTSASIAFIAFVSMIITFIKDRSADKVQKLFTGMFYIVLVGNLYSMSSNYPLVCTMNFRYLMPTVVIGALFVGMVIKRKSKLQRPYSIAMTVAVPCFAAMSSLIYIVVCQKSDLG